MMVISRAVLRKLELGEEVNIPVHFCETSGNVPFTVSVLSPSAFPWYHVTAS